MIDYKNITICPSTLQQGFSTYSPLALRYLFNRKEVPHTLKYKRFGNKKDEQNLIDKRTRISISGVQENIL